MGAASASTTSGALSARSVVEAASASTRSGVLSARSASVVISRPTVCLAGEGSCNVKIKQPTRCNRRESVAGEVFYCKIALSWTGNGRLDPDNVPLALSPLSTGSAGWSGKGGRRGCWGQKNRKQAFAKGIERGEGGRYRAEGASFRIFRGLQGPKWCAGRQTELRGRAQGARTGVAASPLPAS